MAGNHDSHPGNAARAGGPVVFISYAHEDERWLKELTAQLEAGSGAVGLEIWNDRRIEQGGDWYREITAAIDRSRFAVCLVSQHFLSSRFCREDEVPMLLAKHAEGRLAILPVLLEPCPWDTHHWLRSLQHLPEDQAGEPRYVAVHFDRFPSVVFSRVAARIFEAAGAGERGAPAAPAAPVTPAGRRDTTRLPQGFRLLGGRHDELGLLNGVLERDTTRLVVIWSWAGVGKTALVRAWCESLPAALSKRVGPVFGWSFPAREAAGGGASADAFVNEALRFFGDPAPEQGQAWDKGERLALLVARQAGLLVLDGLEPLQARDGTLRDPAVLALLRLLARQQSGWCVVTSRMRLADFTDETYARPVLQHHLDQVSTGVARALLRDHGVAGTDGELEDLVREFGCNALAIRLLPGYLDAAGSPDAAAAMKLPTVSGDPENGQARRVLAAIEAVLGDSVERELVGLLGFFDRPAGRTELEAIIEGPHVSGVTARLSEAKGFAISAAMDRLRALGLVDGDPRDAAIDTHPVVRAYFAEVLRTRFPEGWREGHRRLFRFLTGGLAPAPAGTDETMRLFVAMEHGASAGQFREAWDLYQARLASRAGEGNGARAGMVGAEIEALGALFRERWGEPADGLPPAAKSALLRRVGECLQVLGRVADAVVPMERCLDEDVGGGDSVKASQSAEALSTIHLVLGKLPVALAYADRSVEFARGGTDAARLVYALARRSDILQLMGRDEEAGQGFAEAEAVQAAAWPDRRWVTGVAGFWYCDLLLMRVERALGGRASAGPLPAPLRGEAEEALERARYCHERDRSDVFLRALHRLSEARALLLGAGLRRDEPASPADLVSEAVGDLRRSGRQHWLPKGLLCRAAMRRREGLAESAHRDVAEAFEIARRGGMTPMKLHLVDCLIEQARLSLQARSVQEAADAARQARTLVDEMGYHGRDWQLQGLP